MKTNRMLLALAFGMLLPVYGAASSPDTGSRDAQLQAQAQQKLEHAKLGKDVVLKVDNSAATLSGTVDSVAAKERATKEVMKVHGIVTVVNDLQIANADGGDNKLLERIRHQILIYPYYTIFDYVEAASNGGMVKLTGDVVWPWQKSDIGGIVAGITGVKQVENDIEVLPLSPMDNELRERIALAIYRDPILSRYGIQALPPIHVIVNNGNVKLLGYVHDDVEKSAAFRDARFAATFFDLDNQLVVETAQAKAKP